jgi:hypothetical protein
VLAQEPLRPYRFIGEYVGELLRTADARRRYPGVTGDDSRNYLLTVREDMGQVRAWS